jgi:hypothetical protein
MHGDMISGRLLLVRPSHEESRLVVLLSVGNAFLLFTTLDTHTYALKEEDQQHTRFLSAST